MSRGPARPGPGGAELGREGLGVFPGAARARWPAGKGRALAGACGPFPALPPAAGPWLRAALGGA